MKKKKISSAARKKDLTGVNLVKINDRLEYLEKSFNAWFKDYTKYKEMLGVYLASLSEKPKRGKGK